MGTSELTPLIGRTSGSANKTQKARIWLALFVSVLLGLVSGSLYGFGRFSRALKDLLGLSQLQIQRFGILLDAGSYVSHPVTGYVYDRFGPRTSCVSAALVVFLAYGSIHLGVNSHHDGHTSESSLAAFHAGFFFVGFGSGLGYMAAMGSTTKNFKSTPHLGRTVGLVAAGYGLCSTLVGVTYQYVGLQHFFLFWAVLVAVVNVLGASLITIREKKENSDQSDFEGDEDEVGISLTPLGSPTPQGSRHEPLGTINVEESTRCPDVVFQDNIDERAAEECQRIKTWTSWTNLDFWILFVSFASTTGCGLFVINNLSTMVQSIGGQDSFAGNLVFLLSICNCLGRIMMGLIADQSRLTKITLFRSSSLLMAAALFASAASNSGTAQASLILTVALVSLAYGSIWVLIVLILTQWFGNVHFGKDYGVIIMGPALSGFAFNTASAWIYQQNTVDDSGVCIGLLCYRDAFLLTAVSAVLGGFILPWFVTR